MSIKIMEGSLLDTDAEIICHQVNCQGKMNSGIAKAIREAWPIVFEKYSNYYTSCNDLNLSILGEVQLVRINDSQFVCNLFAQEYYGYDGRRYTSYDAFWNCLNELKLQSPKGVKIAFPYGIGCVRGGANWNIIYKMIEEVLGEDYEVEIRRLNIG